MRGVVGSAERANAALERKRAKREKDLAEKNRAISNAIQNYKREHKKINTELAKEVGVGRDRFSKNLFKPEQFTLAEIREIQNVLGIPAEELIPHLL